MSTNKLVPLVPTEQQWGGLARDIMMAFDLDAKTPRKLLEHLGLSVADIPAWLRDEIGDGESDSVLSKGTRAVIIYRAMVEAVPAAEQAQQAEPVDQQRAGVYRKFNVSRTDGRDLPGGDRHGAEYFVLDVTHDKFAKPALAAYAAACRNDYPALADDMVRRYGIDQQQAEPVGYVAPDELPGLKKGVCAFVYPQPDRHATQPVFAHPPAVPNHVIIKLAVKHFQTDQDHMPGCVFAFAEALLAAAQKGGA